VVAEAVEVAEACAEPVPGDLLVAVLGRARVELPAVEEPREVLVLKAVGEDDADPVKEPLDVTVAHALALDGPSREGDPVEEPKEVLVQEAVVVLEALPAAEGVGEGAARPVGEPLDAPMARALALDEPDGEGDPVKEPHGVLVQEAVVVSEALPVTEGVGKGAVVPVGEPLDVTVAHALAPDEPDGGGDPVGEPQ